MHRPHVSNTHIYSPPLFLESRCSHAYTIRFNSAQIFFNSVLLLTSSSSGVEKQLCTDPMFQINKSTPPPPFFFLPSRGNHTQTLGTIYTSEKFWAEYRLREGYCIYTWPSLDGCKPCSAWFLSTTESGLHCCMSPVHVWNTELWSESMENR